MNKLMSKSAVLMLLFGLLFLATTSDANAQDRCRSRSRVVRGDYYDNNDSFYRRAYDRRSDRFNNDRYNDRYNYDNRDRYARDRYYYNDDENTTGRALRRTGIGAGIGTLGGALIGGKKGAIIGGLLGATGGYVYHRNKVNDQRRYR